MNPLSLLGFSMMERRHYQQLIRRLSQYENDYQQAISFLNAVEESKYTLMPTKVDDEASPLIKRLTSFQETMANLIRSSELVRWHDAGMARFNEILTQHYDDQIVLYNRIVSELCRYVNANQAAIFLIDDQQGGAVINMEACYAYDRKKYLKKTFPLGDNLVGQAIMEKNTIFITKVPQHYTQITSGLGEATPGCILITPLFNESSVVGAIELASFKRFSQDEIRFVESLSKSITSSVFKMKQTHELQALFSRSQMAEAEIRQKEEEIMQQMEELQANNEEMARKSLELERLAKELEEKNRTIEEIRQQEKELLESKLNAQRETYELVISRLKKKIEQQQHQTTN